MCACFQPGAGQASICEPTALLRQILVAPLALERCVANPSAAVAAARAIEACLKGHQLCGKLLLEPNWLESDVRAEAEASAEQVPSTSLMSMI